MFDSNAYYVRGTSKFIRGQWRVWCFDKIHGIHYWGFPGDENLVPSERYRKIPGAIEPHTVDVLL